MRIVAKDISAALWVLAAASVSHSSDAPRDFATAVAPFVTKYCITCHGPTKQSGGLSLAEFKSGDNFSRDKATWANVLERLRGREMPPPAKPQPTDTERAAVVTWLEQQLAASGLGQVTLRRLNRVEYANTVRELFGTDFHPAEGFPLDDVGYGFDNIGDVLSLSPLLFEKYMAAADSVVTGVFTKVQRVRPTLIHTQGHERSIRVSGRDKLHDDQQSRTVFAGEIAKTYRIEHDGRYLFRLHANAHPSAGEWPRVSMRVDGQEIKVLAIRPAKNDATAMPKGRDFAVKSELKAGEHTFGFAFINAEVGGGDTSDVRSVTVHALEVEGPSNPPPPELSPAYRKVIGASPAPEISRAETARRVLTPLVRWAFRREPAPAEIDALVKLAGIAEQQGDSVDDGLKLALKAVLTSPHFLFKVELDPPNATKGQTYPLRDTEFATRLAYFLWSGPPDDELLDMAIRGRLRSHEELKRVARRLLADPRSRALADNFAGQWLQTRNLQSAAIDPKSFPKFDEPLRAAMGEETSRFFDTVVRGDRSIWDLIDADFTFVNERLARHYGIPGVRGHEFRRVSLKGTHRGGLLTHAGILTVTSNSTRTSPVKRGKFVLENFLGASIPPPPPDVPALPEGHELTGTLRQRMEQHRANPMCASCHDRMDPLGFAFEHFDAIGVWRQNDGENPIDASGVLPDGRALHDADDLRRLIREKPDAFRRCLAEKLLTYALGRGMGPVDRRIIDEICTRTAAGGDKFSSLVMAVIESPAFQLRMATGGQR